MLEISKEWADVQQTFKKIWGYDDLRPSQREIVTAL